MRALCASRTAAPQHCLTAPHSPRRRTFRAVVGRQRRQPRHAKAIVRLAAELRNQLLRLHVEPNQARRVILVAGAHADGKGVVGQEVDLRARVAGWRRAWRVPQRPDGSVSDSTAWQPTPLPDTRPHSAWHTASQASTPPPTPRTSVAACGSLVRLMCESSGRVRSARYTDLQRAGEGRGFRPKSFVACGVACTHHLAEGSSQGALPHGAPAAGHTRAHRQPTACRARTRTRPGWWQTRG